ncbi:unnamed protein product, partial [Rotaria sp. Silwood1]
VIKIIQLLGENKTSIPEIEFILNNDGKINTKILQNIDYDIIKMKLKSIGNIGDITDQLDVAQLVARHLCTRYRSQLICLKLNNDNIIYDKPVTNIPPSSSWCCSSNHRIVSAK